MSDLEAAAARGASSRKAAAVGGRSALPMAVAVAFLAALLALLLFLYFQLADSPLRKASVVKKGYSALFSIYGFEGDRLYRPEEVATDRKGRIYIADSFKHRIVVFDRNGKYLEEFGKKGNAYGELEFPSGIAVSDDGRVYVISHSQNKIVVFDRKRRPVWEIKVPEPEAATIKKGKLYVATSRGVMVGDLEGNLLAAFGERGRRPGQFDRPTGIAVDEAGRIYLSDSLNYRLQALDGQGKFRWAVGSPIPEGQAFGRGAIERKFGLPVGLAMDGKGYLYLVDAFAGEIYVFDARGKQMAKYGEWGPDEGQFYYPSGIAYLGDETFAVADKFNDRVQVDRIPSPARRPSEKSRHPYLPLALLVALASAAAWSVRRALRGRAREANSG